MVRVLACPLDSPERGTERVIVRAFLVESVLPLVSVCAAIAGITAVAFDVPSAPPPPASAAPPKLELTPAAIPDTTSKPLLSPKDPRRDQINDVLARAVRALDNPAPALGASAAAPLGTPAPGAETKVFGVVTKLSEAMRIARDAHDEKDLARAEELMRSARQEMEVDCNKAGGSSPLCQSADQIRSLGY